MTNEEINQLTERIFPRVKNVPGLDKEFLRKCLMGISLLHDPQVEERIRNLAKLL
ncbi:MAG TPA: hypothetical protein VHY08_26315 [Bacillota bacterium]|nr:hypothetical protein [Bacillota bacterium]